MKVMYWLVGILLGIPMMFFVFMYAVSELGGEVVTLDRIEKAGDVSQVRIWIVDKDDASWIEHGEANSFWISHLSTSPDIALTREGQTNRYLASPDPDSHALYHQLRRKKYGLADQIVGLFSGPVEECPGVPVRLQLAE